MTKDRILAIISRQLSFHGGHVPDGLAEGIADKIMSELPAESAKGAEPVAWQWEYYKGEPKDCYGLANRKPPFPDAWPLYTCPPDAAAEVERMKESHAFAIEQLTGMMEQRIAKAEAENAALQTVLGKATDIISGEFCSHDGPCSADTKGCYAAFIYAARKP
jgi:hypothetical protein